MHELFSVPWAALELEHVEAFIQDAGEETLVWEAKGQDPRPDGTEKLRTQHVRKEACAFANQIGGYLLLGVSGKAGTWKASGVELPEEPGLWIDQAMGGLHPAPIYEKKYWEIDGGLVVAVVRVEPIAQTPCMTDEGQVFERVSSESKKVTEPLRLAELMARGKVAREQAEAAAATAASELFSHPDLVSERSVWVGVGLHSTNYLPDISTRLFILAFRRFSQSASTSVPLSKPDFLPHPISVVRSPRTMSSSFSGDRRFCGWCGRIGRAALALPWRSLEIPSHTFRSSMRW